MKYNSLIRMNPSITFLLVVAVGISSASIDVTFSLAVDGLRRIMEEKPQLYPPLLRERLWAILEGEPLVSSFSELLIPAIERALDILPGIDLPRQARRVLAGLVFLAAPGGACEVARNNLNVWRDNPAEDDDYARKMARAKRGLVEEIIRESRCPEYVCPAVYMVFHLLDDADFLGNLDAKNRVAGQLPVFFANILTDCEVEASSVNALLVFSAMFASKGAESLAGIEEIINLAHF